MPPRYGNIFQLLRISTTQHPLLQSTGCFSPMINMLSSCRNSELRGLPQQYIRSTYCTTNTPYEEEPLEIVYKHGVPTVDVMLPSRDEKCQFTVRPLTDTVGTFIDAVKAEDGGIQTVSCYRPDGTKIAKSTKIDRLLQEKFDLVINSRKFAVSVPGAEVQPQDEHGLDQVKELVTQLYTTMNLTEWHANKELEIQKVIDNLKEELEPYDKLRVELMEKAGKSSDRLAWIGLGLMGFQFGILARLTWWEYSWDIMEPVTYFVTYGTTIVMFAYYVLTKQEYVFPDIRNREIMKHFHKNARKVSYDVDHYNSLLDKLIAAENDLKQLKQPFGLSLSETELRALLQAKGK